MPLRVRRAVLSVPLVATVLLPQVRAEAAAPLTEAQAVKAFAPQVRLHPDEQHFPLNPGEFIAGSRLRYDRFGPDGHLADGGKVDPARLGGGGYQYGGHRTNEPRDKNTDGFFLELEDHGLRAGRGTSAAALYHFVAGRSLTYWFFYGYSNSEGPVNHEGDWERIVLRLGPDNRPTAASFFAHGGRCVIPWSQVTKAGGTHPVVYASLGDHASYPTPGEKRVEFFGTDKRADGGPTWNPAANGLVDVTGRAWYGYTGAWGEIGNSRHTTGPQGPGAKRPGPGDFTGGAC